MAETFETNFEMEGNFEITSLCSDLLNGRRRGSQLGRGQRLSGQPVGLGGRFSRTRQARDGLDDGHGPAGRSRRELGPLPVIIAPVCAEYVDAVHRAKCVHCRLVHPPFDHVKVVFLDL